MLMNSKDSVLARERARGRAAALDLAVRAPQLTATQIVSEFDHIPAWREDAVYTASMVGYPVQDGGRVFVILQPHTPAYNPGVRPADLPAIYSIKHTTDPRYAAPWLAPNGTSGMYMIGECCTEAGGVYQSLVDNNVWNPTGYPSDWAYIGTVEEVQAV